jgi:cystathionine beta-lyase/cystathionine gamma-synthase
MVVWLTFVGTSPMAVVNSLWYAKNKDKVIPSKIYLFINEDLSEGLLKKTKDEIRCILKKIKIEEVKFNQTEIDGILSKIRDVIFKESPSNVVVDITAGRKFMSAIAMYIGLIYKVNKILYFYLKDDTYLNKRYDEIPILLMEHYDLKKWEKELKDKR